MTIEQKISDVECDAFDAALVGRALRTGDTAGLLDRKGLARLLRLAVYEVESGASESPAVRRLTLEFDAWRLAAVEVFSPADAPPPC